MSISFPKVEEETLERWREIKAFETQVKLSEGQPRFTFYDGPPFGTVARSQTSPLS
jgi:isoleucyl-tRNA synthetase